MMNAAWGLTATVPWFTVPSGGQIFLPVASRTSRIIVRGMRTPPFAMAP